MPKLHCAPSVFARTATRAAQEAGLDPVKLLAGVRGRAYTACRWGVWRDFAGRGYSYKSIARAAGFDHTSVIFACKATHAPYRGAA